MYIFEQFSTLRTTSKCIFIQKSTLKDSMFIKKIHNYSFIEHKEERTDVWRF